MRKTPRLAIPALALIATLGAQNPPGRASIAGKFDTPQVRVYVATLAPHTPVQSRNGHATNRVLIYLDNGAMTRQDGDRKAELRSTAAKFAGVRLVVRTWPRTSAIIPFAFWRSI